MEMGARPVFAPAIRQAQPISASTDAAIRATAGIVSAADFLCCQDAESFYPRAALMPSHVNP